MSKIKTKTRRKGLPEACFQPKQSLSLSNDASFRVVVKNQFDKGVRKNADLFQLSWPRGYTACCLAGKFSNTFQMDDIGGVQQQQASQSKPGQTTQQSNK